MFKDKTNLYEIRLNFPSLNSLESRRERGDIIEVFKIMNGYVDVNYNQLFTLRNNDKLKGYSLTLFKQYSRLYIRKYSFVSCVLTLWNNLLDKVMNANSVVEFKKLYDHYFKDNREISKQSCSLSHCTSVFN